MGCVLTWVDYIFDDKRVGIACLMGWLLIVLMLFYDIGLFGGQYMQMGPSPNTLFMHITLDTWYKWNMVAIFTAINTCINDFMSDAISPWLLNTITDHKTKYLPYPKYQCLMISQLWSLYCGIMGIAGIMISLTQVDFVIIRIICDLIISLYTNYKFMRTKIYDRNKYFDLDEQHGAQELNACIPQLSACSNPESSETEELDSSAFGTQQLIVAEKV